MTFEKDRCYIGTHDQCRHGKNVIVKVLSAKAIGGSGDDYLCAMEVHGCIMDKMSYSRRFYRPVGMKEYKQLL